MAKDFCPHCIEVVPLEFRYGNGYNYLRCTICGYEFEFTEEYDDELYLGGDNE